MALPIPGRRRTHPLDFETAEEHEYTNISASSKQESLSSSPLKRKRLETCESETDAHESFEADRDIGRKSSLHFKLSKQQIFLSSLAAWYEELSDRKKSTLTKKILKRKALQVANQISLEYQHIPLDWLTKLRDECGLEVYQRVKNGNGTKSIKGEPFLDDDDEEDDDGVKESKKVVEKNTAGIKNEVNFTSSGRKIKPVKFIVLTEKGGHKLVDSTQLPLLNIKKEKFRKEDKVAPAKPKIIDKSSVAPPAWWIEKYNKTGIAPPRELTLHKEMDKLILCYDYNLPEDHYSKFEKKKLNGGEETRDVNPGPAPKPKPVQQQQQVRYVHEGNAYEWLADENEK